MLLLNSRSATRLNKQETSLVISFPYSCLNILLRYMSSIFRAESLSTRCYYRSVKPWQITWGFCSCSVYRQFCTTSFLRLEFGTWQNSKAGLSQNLSKLNSKLSLTEPIQAGLSLFYSLTSYLCFFGTRYFISFFPVVQIELF